MLSTVFMDQGWQYVKFGTLWLNAEIVCARFLNGEGEFLASPWTITASTP